MFGTPTPGWHRGNDEFLRFAKGDQAFAAWLRELDQHLHDLLDVGIFDLSDLGLRDKFDDGLSAEEVAHDIVADPSSHI